MDITAILLAAGDGRRFDPGAKRLKLLEPWTAGPGKTEPIAVLAARSLRAAVGPVIAVVSSAPSLEQERLRTLLRALGCEVVACTPNEAGAGIGASIACAVRASPGAGGWIVALADMPDIRESTIASIREAIVRGAPSAAPYYQGRRGHPVGFGAECAAQLAALTGDQGARAVLERHPPLRIDVDDPGVLFDVDVPGDLARAHATAANNIP